MACYRPLHGFKSRTTNESGKRGIVFNPRDGFIDQPVSVPCGQCIGCKLERSRQWAIRCLHESTLHDENCFITLTYAPEHLPEDNSLDKKHFQDFMKRLRKYYQPKKIRYFHCGEYGEQLNRPHYHACLFGHDFEDKIYWKKSNDNKLYISEILQALWPWGHSTVGALTFQSAAYTARYITKKQTGPKAEDHYRIADPSTGEYFDLLPEYTTMSRRPGIGHGWFERFKTDAYPSDFLVVNGKKVRPPKFYDDLLRKEDEQTYKKIKYIRNYRQKQLSADNTTARLYVKEKVKLSAITLLRRDLENA